MNVAARAGVVLIHAYQFAVAPLTGGACRFDPSCSAYAAGAITAHGLWRGSWLALRRVSRCHPLGGSGLDPVPPAGRPTRPASD